SGALGSWVRENPVAVSLATVAAGFLQNQLQSGALGSWVRENPVAVSLATVAAGFLQNQLQAVH
ncbi:hypothetical protein, partial [Myxococcus xanthus]|uniref:hypothetical protein n=1 Tax=Myxococcus xanthus TaxID=34 RepID=UPI001C0F7C9D